MDEYGDDGLDPLFPPSFPHVPASFEMQSQSEASYASFDRAPRVGLQALDLNSQADEFPSLAVYSDILAGRGGRTLGLRPPCQGAIRGRGQEVSAGLDRGQEVSAGLGRGQEVSAALGRGQPMPTASGARRRRAPAMVAAAAADAATAAVGGAGGSRMAAGRGAGGGRGGRPCGQVSGRGGGSRRTRTPNTLPEQSINVEDDEEEDECMDDGYNDLAEKFYVSTGLRHDKDQLRNRKDQLKALYQFWCRLQKDTGLGRNPDGSIAASKTWWKDNTKGKPEWRRLQFGDPEYLDCMHLMFKDVVVDGSTSYVPGQDDGEEEEEEEQEEGEEEDEDPSPISSNSRKRSSSTGSMSTATSPPKKSKSAMVQVFRHLVNKWNSQDEAGQKALMEVQKEIAREKIAATKEAARERYRATKEKMEAEHQQKMEEENRMAQSVRRCQELALEAGVAPDSIEFFACKTIFKEAYDRQFFCNIPTPEARLVFLKRWCQSNNMY
ncbi:unnamed protein product [Urochloa decumbens]|uniref:Myb/SANT-like domain-containing protein n=1 Tax=Urochloa decumbens TaxID=240449 RepID=A0ABC9F7Z2_9POAL